MKPKIHILIPTFNRSKLLLSAVQSVVDQTYTNWKLTIIDNGSTDDSVKLLKKIFPKLIKQKKININSYRADCMNTNMNRCMEEVGDYKYFKILMSDDKLNKNFLKIGISLLEKGNNNVVGFGSAIKLFDINDKVIGKRTYGFLGFEFWLSVFVRNYLGTPTSHIYRASFFKKKRFKTLHYMGDIVFVSDYYIEKKKFIFSKLYLSYFRLHENSDTGRSKYKIKKVYAKKYCREKILGKMIFRFEIFKKILFCFSKLMFAIELVFFKFKFFLSSAKNKN